MPSEQGSVFFFVIIDSGDPKSDPDYARPAVDMGLIGSSLSLLLPKTT